MCNECNDLYAWKYTYVTVSATSISFRWACRIVLIGLAYIISQGNVHLVSYFYQYSYPISLVVIHLVLQYHFVFVDLAFVDGYSLLQWRYMVMLCVFQYITSLSLLSDKLVLLIYQCTRIDVKVYYWVGINCQNDPIAFCHHKWHI